MRTAIKKRGFTLLEIVIVMAVMGILASVIYPVFVRARLDAKRATSTSNLRQCWLTLRMYCDDHGGDRAMPTGEVATQVLKAAPTCDPNDTWRTSCDEEFGPPLVGSYAYVRYIDHGNINAAPLSSQEGWNAFLSYKPNPTLMASIYYADSVPEPFQGNSPPMAPGNFYMPNRVLYLGLDGSVRSENEDIGRPYSDDDPGSGMRIFMWSSLF